MRISLNWLQNYVELTETDHDKIKEVITARSAEVETMESVGAHLENVVLGKVEKLLPHPNADRLTIAMVNDGQETIKVVCGGSNLKEGMKMAYAKIGAVVKWHGDQVVKMEKVKIRGEESSGMICASEEIGLAEMFPKKEDHEIVDLSHIDAPVGTPLAKALGMDDVVVDIDNHAITNRADLFSHRGFAREFVANGLAKWKKGAMDVKPIEFPNTPLPIDIKITQPELCSRYLAVYLTDVEIKQSPDWMKQYLAASGVRPISNIVDITNYIMFDFGMPLHAFDLDQVKGKTWTMRPSKKGEKLITLDEKEFELFEGVTVFDDDNELFDLCGVMGGLHSGINMKTNKVLLHVPVYHPTLVRKAMRGLGQVSDAGIIYEKGVSNEVAMDAMMRAIELILEMSPGAKVASKLLEINNYQDQKRMVELSKDYLNRLIGIEIAEKDVERILEVLGFEVDNKKEAYHVSVPSWRLGDINIPADLVEEIGRVYGYDNIPSIIPTCKIEPVAKKPRRVYEKQLKEQLVQFGFNEIYTFAFLGEELLEKSGMKKNEESIEIVNPISNEMSIMRQSLLPRMLETIKENLKLKSTFRLFELSRTYHKKGDGVEEKSALIMAITDEDSKNVPRVYPAQYVPQYGESGRSFRMLQGLVESLNIDLRSANQHKNYQHPGRHANLFLRGQNVGSIYQLHPSIGKDHDMDLSRYRPMNPASFPIVIAEIDIETIHEMNIKYKIKYGEIPKYPSIERHISLLINKKDLAENYLKAIQKADKKLIKLIRLTDQYTNDKIGTDKRGLTYSITYRADDRTLKEEEVSEIHAKVLENVKKAGAVVRD